MIEMIVYRKDLIDDDDPFWTNARVIRFRGDSVEECIKYFNSEYGDTEYYKEFKGDYVIS